MTAAARRQAVPARIEAGIEVEDPRWPQALPSFADLVDASLAATARRTGLPADVRTELGVTLADDAAVRVLNARWRGIDRPTNVLSFPIAALAPGDAPGLMLGDLVLALETLRREADGEGRSMADHFCHLVVHGALHCLGYDHADERGAQAMEALETLILADLGIADPYRESEPEKEPARA